MVIVHDYRQFVKFGRDEKKLFERSKQVANIVNALYAPLNIFVVLVGVRVWSQRDEIEVDINAEKTLDNFLRYRMEVLAKSIPNDNAQLVTDLTFEKDVVGKALKGPICTYQYSGGVNKDHHESVAVVAATIAHELGHNFGMEHDDLGSCHCPQSRCIMFPASNAMVPPTAWSSCSMNAIHEAFSQHMDHCLLNVPTKIVGASCGNGIVEDGEECDCGPENFCTTKCCNPKTCKLNEGATCGHGECCDLATCLPRRAGVKCRDQDGECDLSEHCDGKSHFCPRNVFKANGEKCGDGDAYCYMGSCASHNMQCKKLWGQTGHVGHRACFSVNVNGTQIGNCGYDKIRKGYAKCKQKDIMCGTLHCTYVTERLEYGMLSASKLSRFFLRTEKETHTCRSAMVDLGPTDPDPGQAPDGAACGVNQACLSARCVELAQLASPPCEYSCFGHGICNHLGHCHCDPGYAPPYCNFPGKGGSVDSGPTTNPEEETYTVTIILSVVFLGVTPLVLFFIAWTIFSKKDLISKYRLRRRKLAVKHAARQGPLLNLYDKSQISKPVFTKAPPTNGVHKGSVQPINQPQAQNHHQVQQPVLNGIVKMVETTNLDVEHQSQIRPARPAPPPPPGKARAPTQNVQNADNATANNLKRTKSSNNSIRRPSAPPPPKPSPLYENMEALRAQMNNELKTAVNTQKAGDESHPLV
ncbi:zinc metalloproteinase-disintegrin-like atrolysin-A [Galendromus occidentalis]|uniref:Zinc metalloproteinase-disintegrin-like atrolysin-A n=1 Tax=Galendromus occidentalis TaxID=34638 RepID=A0AAJ7SJ35_9ACAR|nr:zinc metalloproteinase-disintegrin-like atrolysin-A [Galendromus occidentalis]